MTELIWDGKYKDGKRMAPVRIALPFQTVETVNESAQERQLSLLSLYGGSGSSEWRNRLIWGDKKYVLPSLLPEFAGKINLIYIDPPFDTGADFSFTTTIPDSDASFTKEPSMIEQKAYRDTWGRGLDSYLQWFYETVILLRELLADDGSLYVHLDWHVDDYAKVILDEVFGKENLRNIICWAYRSGGASRTECLPRKHDNILFYAKSTAFKVNSQLERQYLAKSFMGSQQDNNGRHYVDTLLRDVLEGEIVISRQDGLSTYYSGPLCQHREKGISKVGESPFPVVVGVTLRPFSAPQRTR